MSAFQNHHIKLRLRGTRLPKGYTISLRLPSVNNRHQQPTKPRIKRQRIAPSDMAKIARRKESSTSSGTDDDLDAAVDGVSSQAIGDSAAVASEGEDEDAAIRANNAYPGAANTIGSIHQRHWFLTLDRRNSGFHKAQSGPDRGRWVGSWEPFFVCGRDVERSVVTGRLADDVMADEGVEEFVGRKLWRPVME